MGARVDGVITRMEALVPCTHKNPDAEEDSCRIVNSEIVKD